MEAALITADEIRELTGVEANLNGPQKLGPQLIPTQRRRIKSVLGPNTYTDLCDAVEAAAAEDGPALSDALSALLEQVKPALANYVIYDVWPHLVVNVAQSGILLRQGQNSESADRADRSDARARFLENADQYLSDLLQFLKDNSADYPSYTVPACVEPVRNPGGICLDD